MPKDDFSGQNLDDVNLSGANMQESDLSKASLRRARLKGARLQDANLAESDLHGADLNHVDITGADLRHADITAANLHGVDLEQAASTEGIRLAGATGVSNELAHIPGDQAEQLRVGRTVDDLADINRDIINTARSLFDRSHVGRRAPTTADRRAAMEYISELMRRRDALEHRLVTSIAEGMD